MTRLTLSTWVHALPGYCDGTRPALSEVGITAKLLLSDCDYGCQASLLSNADHTFDSADFTKMLREFADHIDRIAAPRD